MIPEKPSLEDMIEHHGVKGQKWGVKKAKPSSSDIQGARARIGSQTRQINSQIDRLNLSTGKTADKEAKKLSDMHASFLRNPDRATALRLTRGEKAALSILALVPGPGTVAAGVVAGSRVAARKQIEKSQAK